VIWVNAISVQKKENRNFFFHSMAKESGMKEFRGIHLLAEGNSS
jgi:hypothetical protein